MKSKQKGLIGAMVAAIALACGTASAAWPEKSITIIVPTSAGGANDALARTIGQAMSLALKQTVIVENKAGANGSIASEFVKRAAPDGYTIMLGYIATHAMNPALQKLRYDPVADFEPIGMVGSSATLMVTSTRIPANNVKEFVAQQKSSKEPLSYASAGNGNHSRRKKGPREVPARISTHGIVLLMPHCQTGHQCCELHIDEQLIHGRHQSDDQDSPRQR